ncbi:hypothetical protein [Halosimplex marinum]
MTCDNCGADVTEIADGYVCGECRTVVVDDVGGWNVFARRLFE